MSLFSFPGIPDMCCEDAADLMHIGGPDNRKSDLRFLCQPAFCCDLRRMILVL